MSNNLQTQNSLLLSNLMKFYEKNDNLDKILKIINGNSKISLRLIDWFSTNYSKKNFEKAYDFRSGDTIKVDVKVTEGERTRIQSFRGVVIKIRGTGVGKSFTVRKADQNFGVERTFPYECPSIDSIEVLRKGKVRRSKLYYLRGLSDRKSRIKESR